RTTLQHLPPPPVTLFPYTTLFRSFGNDRLWFSVGAKDEVGCVGNLLVGPYKDLRPAVLIKRIQTGLPDHANDCPRSIVQHDRRRSEEHTSELQSLAYLVCRLRLEK